MEIGRIWQQILLGKKYPGGDIEVHIGGDILRGRIGSFQINYWPRGAITFFAKWIARFNPDKPGRWEKFDWPEDKPMVEFLIAYFKPEKRPHGGIGIIPIDGKSKIPITIFPFGTDNLDPHRVSGLDL